MATSTIDKPESSVNGSWDENDLAGALSEGIEDKRRDEVKDKTLKKI